MLTEHKRIKLGALPGQIPMGMLIQVREFRGPHILADGSVIGEEVCKSLRRFMKARSRPVQRQRDRRAIHEGLTA